MSSTIHYAVCPITGLSSTIQDDYLHNDLWERTHLIVADPSKLYKLIETKVNSIPRSYLIAGILLQLTEQELIVNPHLEPQYLRGGINEALQTIPHYHLVELYWDCRNTRAHLNSSPLTINLTTAGTQKAYGLYKSIKAIACQDVCKADMDTYFRSRSTLKKKARARVRVRMDLKTVCDRIATLLPKLHNGLATTELELASIKKVASLIRWDDAIGSPRFLSVNLKIKTRIIEILEIIATEAMKSYLLERDSLNMKSIDLLIKYLTGELKDATLEEDWTA